MKHQENINKNANTKTNTEPNDESEIDVLSIKIKSNTKVKIENKVKVNIIKKVLKTLVFIVFLKDISHFSFLFNIKELNTFRIKLM